jgi:hypothetical protein
MTIAIVKPYMHEYNGKILACVSLLLLVVGVVGVSFTRTAFAVNTPSLYVDPSSYVAASFGQAVPIGVDVYMYNINLTGYQFQLSFNPTLLQCMNASVGRLFQSLPSIVSSVTEDNVKGIISISANIQTGGNPVSGFGPVLSVFFNATYSTQYPQQATCPLQISNDTLYGTGTPPQILAHNTVNGSYQAPIVPPQLGLTMSSSSPFNGRYYLENRITVNGSLTGNGYPILNGLVALEIRDPNNFLVVTRTLPTSFLPVSTPLQITALTPCDSEGDPQSSFQVGSYNELFFDVKIKNPSSSSITAVVTEDPYDSSNASLGVLSQQVLIPADSTYEVLSQGMPLQTPPFYTPATSGNATVYASVWSDFLENGGVPISTESSATFTITGTAQGSPLYTSSPPQGTYKADFILHWTNTDTGNYTMNVATTFMGKNATQSSQIYIKLGGDINGDGKVNLSDLVLLAKAYGSHRANYDYQGEPASPNWNSNADINGDGHVSLSDLSLLAKNYGKGVIY